MQDMLRINASQWLARGFRASLWCLLAPCGYFLDMFTGMYPPPTMAASFGVANEAKSKEAAEKQAHADAEAKKAPEEKLRDAERECATAGARLAARVAGMLDRETGKLVDQFAILDGHESAVSAIVAKIFLKTLDKKMQERDFHDE